MPPYNQKNNPCPWAVSDVCTSIIVMMAPQMAQVRLTPHGQAFANVAGLAFIVLGVGWFALCLGYAALCARL